MVRMVAALLAAVMLVPAGAEVLPVTGANFDKMLKGTKVLAVNFYLPWCAHSKKLEPEFERASMELKDKVQFAKVDASADHVLSSLHTTSYPSIVIFFDGTSNGIEYTGERKVESLVSFLSQTLKDPVAHLSTEAQYRAAMESASAKESHQTVVGVFGKDHSTEAVAFAKVASKMRGKHSFYTVDGDLVKTLEASEGFTSPHIIAASARGAEAFTGKHTDDGISSFLTERSFPLFGEMVPGATFEAYAKRGLPIAWLFTDGSKDSAITSLKPLGTEFKGKLSMVWIDGRKYSPMMEQLGLKGAKLPAFAIEDKENHYAFTGEVTAAAVKAWISRFLDSKLQKSIRTQPPPSDIEKDGLTTLIGTNVETVCSRARDVVLLVHAPWCSHCQALMPVYKAFAKKNAGPKLTVAVIDGTQNDIPSEYNVDGYPTILFFPENTKRKMVTFGGERSVEGLEAFVERATDFNDEL